MNFLLCVALVALLYVNPVFFGLIYLAIIYAGMWRAR